MSPSFIMISTYWIKKTIKLVQNCKYISSIVLLTMNFEAPIFDNISNWLINITVFSVCPSPINEITKYHEKNTHNSLICCHLLENSWVPWKILLVDAVPPKYSRGFLLLEYVPLARSPFPIKIFLCHLEMFIGLE